MSLITPDFGLLFWMVLIFGIVFFLLAKFGFPMITGMVDERSKRIEDSIAKAREAEQKLSELAEEQAGLIEQTRLEQGRLLREVAQSREQIIAQAKADAEAEAAKVLEDARAKIAEERENAVRDIRRQVSMISVEVAEKLVRKELSDEAGQLELLDKLVDEASRNHMS
ncbi:MAG: F0F1 ATP synthase subunit B [Bacteroidales bacterium]|nr:F0F1 ATP synthase subunit B [Bacteroidales bacterium]